MSARLALLFLLAGAIPAASGCVQCDSKIRSAFEKIRKNVPNRVQDETLRRRCDVVVTGMAGSFFKDYAVKHFTGVIQIQHYEPMLSYIETEAKALQNSKERDQDFLDALTSLRRNITMSLKFGLKVYRNKACSPSECGWLKMKVFSCTKCKSVKPSCLSRRACADKEERTSLVFREGEAEAAMLSAGLYVVGFSALLLLLLLSLLALMYWVRMRSLRRRTEPV